MRTPGGVAFLVVVLITALSGCMSPRYNQEELDQAAEVVRQYYAHVENQEFDQALLLLQPPEDLVRDWEFEARHSADELRKMALSGEYRLSGFDWVRSNGEIRPMGAAEDLVHSNPLRFVVRFETDVQGNRTSLNETVHVVLSHGLFRIASFESKDHFVRFRAYSFELARVLNAPPD